MADQNGHRTNLLTTGSTKIVNSLILHLYLTLYLYIRSLTIHSVIIVEGESNTRSPLASTNTNQYMPVV